MQCQLDTDEVGMWGRAVSFAKTLKQVSCSIFISRITMRQTSLLATRRQTCWCVPLPYIQNKKCIPTFSKKVKVAAVAEVVPCSWTKTLIKRSSIISETDCHKYDFEDEWLAVRTAISIFKNQPSLTHERKRETESEMKFIKWTNKDKSNCKRQRGLWGLASVGAVLEEIDR